MQEAPSRSSWPPASGLSPARHTRRRVPQHLPSATARTDAGLRRPSAPGGSAFAEHGLRRGAEEGTSAAVPRRLAKRRQAPGSRTGGCPSRNRGATADLMDTLSHSWLRHGESLVRSPRDSLSVRYPVAGATGSSRSKRSAVDEASPTWGHAPDGLSGRGFCGRPSRPLPSIWKPGPRCSSARCSRC